MTGSFKKQNSGQGNGRVFISSASCWISATPAHSERKTFLFFFPCKAFTCALRTTCPLCTKHQMSVQVTGGSLHPVPVTPVEHQRCPHHASQQAAVALLYKPCSVGCWVGARCPAAMGFSQTLLKSPARDIVFLLFIKELCLFCFLFFIVVAYLHQLFFPHYAVTEWLSLL